MALLPSTAKKCYTPNFNKIKGAKEGKLYEIISLLSFAKRGYELSKQENSEFREFSVGREIGIGKDRKLDDVVFSYVDEENKKNLIFLQLKHYQYYNIVDSGIISTEADRAKDAAAKAKHFATRVQDVRYGNMCKDFNLQKYFISYLSVRDELKNANTKELKDGKIKYVVLFTNNGLDTKELQEKGFILKKAPYDIVNLFTLSSKTQHLNHCYQLGDVSIGLSKILKKSSDLDRLARSLAQYVVCEDYRKNRIMGICETPIKYYHVALEREVIQKSTLKQRENGQYFREAQFREDFLDCDETAPNLYPLREALFEAIRELDESKKDANPDELKRILKDAKWKIVYNFEKSKQTDFPSEWIPVRDEDIKEFLQCFVFIVNQPRVSELELLYQCSIQSLLVENTSLKPLIDQINTTGPEFRDCVEKIFGLDIKPHDDEKWISNNQIEDFMKEKQQLLRRIFVVSAMTLMYKNEIMQYGEFNDLGKVIDNVDSFLKGSCKILCVNTPVTSLSSIKILQHLSRGKDYPISVSLNILNCTENRDYVLKAFELENISLLTIECRDVFKDQDDEYFQKLFNIAKINSNKKIILIMQQDICTKEFKNVFQDKGICVIENDSIDLKNFKPKEDLLAKKVLVFQEQKEKQSLSDITGIDSWHSYVDKLSEERCKQDIIDGMTLVEILTNDEIEIGSKPAGTSSLEGAYSQIYEEINVENFVNKLTSQEHGNDTNMYIISGISGSNKQEKTDKMIQYLGLSNNKGKIQDQLGDISSEGKIQIADDQFKDRDFQRLCHRFSKKRIFWISVKCENGVIKLILEKTYNPNFYLKRKFKNVLIKKDLKEQLIKDDLFEIFIFHCVEDKQQLYKSMELNELEVGQLEDNRKVRIFFQKSAADAAFRELSKQNETVHFLEFEKQQIVWCESHGSVKYLQKYIDHKLSELEVFHHERNEVFSIEEDKLIAKIKDRKVVIFADDPGMGKSTTLVKLYETEIEFSSVIESHWVIGIKLRDNLDAVLDHEFEKDGIGILNLIEFLTKIDLKLNNNLAKNLLKIVLDTSGSFQAKPLLLIFDGFDEVLDEDIRNRILLLLKFIKNKTAAKIWITTRCHFKNLLEVELSTIAFKFSPMDDTQQSQYITSYLQHRMYLILNKEKFAERFYTDDENQNNEIIHMYTAAFINKTKSIFRGDIATYIGTPLQLYLMLKDTAGDFKKWIEEGEGKIPDLKCIRNDVCEVYENFINRKYDVYFQKRGNRERVQQKYEKFKLDKDHKKFAVSKIFKEKTDNDFEQCKDMFLLVGVIKSQRNDMEFIHKTFEEFFASKVFIDWINNAPQTYKQEYLLKIILMNPDYQLSRTFMNLQLQKMTEIAGEGEVWNELDKSLERYGNVAAELLNEEKSPLINKDEKTPLHIAVLEGNKYIACFLLNILKKQPDVLEKFIFIPKPYSNTALHLACMREDVQIVTALLDAATVVTNDTLQQSIASAFQTAKMCNKNVEICKKLLDKANDKLALIMKTSIPSALCTACLHGRDNFVELFLKEFEHDKHSLEKLLLYNDKSGNALCCARSATTIEMLISAAKSMEDDNKTLKKLLFPNEGKLPFQCLVFAAEFDAVEKILNVAKEIDEDTLKQLLLNDEYVPAISALHVAAKRGRVDIIKLLLETASALGIKMLEKLITAFDEKRKNAIHLIFEHGHETIIEEFLKIFEEDKYKKIRKKIMEIYDSVPLETRLYWYKKTLFMSIELDHIKEVKNILNKVKNFSINRNESRKILLLSDKYFERSTLHIACERGNDEIIKELLSYTKEIDDDNHTLQQLLLRKQTGESTLHVAAKNGHANIIKLLLEAAAELGIDILEKLIFDVNEKGKNAIQLLVEHGHERYFADSFKMLKDEYPIICSKVMEMYDNISLKSRIYSDTRKFIMAVESGDIQKVKDILSNTKNFGINPNKGVRILLLSKNKLGYSTLHTACKEGNTEIIKELFSYAKEIDDDNCTLRQLLLLKRKGKSALHVTSEKDHVNITEQLLEISSDLYIDDDNNTPKQLVSNERYGESALHLAARWGHFDITKLLLETASGLGTEILEELIFAVNKNGKNAIQLMAEYGYETNFADYFKILKYAYPIIWKKVMEMYDNIPLGRRLYRDKKKLIMAIKLDDITKVKEILNKVKYSSVNPNKSLKILLLSKNKWGNSTIHTACKEENTEIMKELLSCAMNMDDGGATFKEILTKPSYMSLLTPLKARKHGYESGIKQILDSLIVEARNNNTDHAINILEHINSQYSKDSLEELDDIPKGTIFKESSLSSLFDFSSFSPEDVLQETISVKKLISTSFDSSSFSSADDSQETIYKTRYCSGSFSSASFHLEDVSQETISVKRLFTTSSDSSSFSSEDDLQKKFYNRRGLSGEFRRHSFSSKGVSQEKISYKRLRKFESRFHLIITKPLVNSYQFIKNKVTLAAHCRFFHKHNSPTQHPNKKTVHFTSDSGH